MSIKTNMNTMNRVAELVRVWCDQHRRRPKVSRLRLHLKYFWFLLGIALSLAGSQELFAASPVPGQMPAGPVALVGGVIHPVSGPEIPDGVLIFDQGKIVALGKGVAIPANAEKIDLKGQYVYPGLIDAHTHLGLSEIMSVKATVDQAETGEINPNVKAQVAV